MIHNYHTFITDRFINIVLATFFIAGALSQGTTFQTPDILTISYIKSGLFLDCEQQLREVVGTIGVCSESACTALETSANIDPSDSFSNMNGNGGDFDKWTRT